MYPRYSTTFAAAHLKISPMIPILVFEACYGLAFVAVEFFFRGFMVFALARYMGRAVILPMVAVVPLHTLPEAASGGGQLDLRRPAVGNHRLLRAEHPRRDHSAPGHGLDDGDSGFRPDLHYKASQVTTALGGLHANSIDLPRMHRMRLLRRLTGWGYLQQRDNCKGRFAAMSKRASHKQSRTSAFWVRADVGRPKSPSRSLPRTRLLSSKRRGSEPDSGRADVRHYTIEKHNNKLMRLFYKFDYTYAVIIILLAPKAAILNILQKIVRLFIDRGHAFGKNHLGTKV